MRRLASVLAVPFLLMLLTAPAVQAAAPATAFSGHWEATDPGDGSNLDAVIVGAAHVRILYTDDDATSACEGQASPFFTSMLIGAIDGDELFSTMRVAKCGNRNVHFNGLQISWTLDEGDPEDLSDDVLTNSFGEAFTRA